MIPVNILIVVDFPAPFGAEVADQLTGEDVEGDVVDRRDHRVLPRHQRPQAAEATLEPPGPAELLPQVLHLDHRLARHRSRGYRPPRLVSCPFAARRRLRSVRRLAAELDARRQAVRPINVRPVSVLVLALVRWCAARRKPTVVRSTE